MTATVIPFPAPSNSLTGDVAEAIKSLWNEGHRQPELSGMVHDQFPGLSVQAFNRAADIAWKEIDGGAA